MNVPSFADNKYYCVRILLLKLLALVRLVRSGDILSLYVVVAVFIHSMPFRQVRKHRTEGIERNKNVSIQYSYKIKVQEITMADAKWYSVYVNCIR